MSGAYKQSLKNQIYYLGINIKQHEEIIQQNKKRIEKLKGELCPVT